MNLGGVVVAAGSGERFGGPKALVEVGGVPMWRLAADLLESAGAAPVVVVGDVPGGIPGGRRRRDSVAAGVAALPDDVAWVLVHDAARPLATTALARRVAGRLLEGDVDAVVPVIPVRDTLKRVEGGRVVETADRTGLAAVQTPQGFRRAALAAAQAADDRDASDDAALVERHGGVVATVPGDPANLKVTYPEDLALVEALR
ncbi:MAG: 2-C-methyl-D-erythritol 4-phosphate cytidylyltransferase [Actinobacteria bacterium]|nr:2-C-methyl-D-erythritol 4-phosphate cytidylyltransferase [Actinomycetota bacterium]